MPNVVGSGVSTVDNEITDSGDILSLASYGSTSSTSFGVFMAGDFALVFQGSGFTSFTGNFANTGTITSILHYDLSSGTVLTETWGSLTADAGALLAALQANDDAAVASILFGGADTINGSTFGGDNLWGYGGADVLVPFGGSGGDYVNGGDGTDYIVSAGMAVGDTFDGGADDDAIVATLGSTINDPDSGLNGFRQASFGAGTLLNFEYISFAVSSPVDQVAVFDADQFGAGLISNAVHITESAESNVVQVNALGGVLDLSAWVFNAGWQGLVGGEFDDNSDAVYVAGSAGVDTVTGTVEGDRLEGNGGNDTLNGGDGDDSIDGGAGVDQIHGGNGDDRVDLVVSGYAAGETYDGGAGTDDLLYVVFDSAQVVDLTTTAALTGFESIEFDTDGNAWTFTAIVMSGAQAAGFGSATGLTGSSTSVLDVLVINAASAATLNLSGWQLDGTNWVNGDRVVFNGSTSGDSYVGTSGIDYVYGGTGGVDTLNGGGGDDFIIASGAVAGESYSGGSSGMDALVIERGTIISDPGEFFDGFYASDYTAGSIAAIDQISFGNPTGSGLLTNQFNSNKTAIFTAAQVTGGLASNLNVVGTSGHTEVVQVLATGGTLNLSSWSFSIWQPLVGGEYNTNDDFVYVQGSSGVDTITGSSTGDRLEGNDGADTLNGGDGDDSIEGGAGVDQLHGGNGNDFIDLVVSGYAAGETYDGGAGTGDLLYVTFDSALSVDISGSTLTGFERIEFDNDGNAWAACVLTISAAQAAALGSTTTLAGSDPAMLDVLVIAGDGATTLNLSTWLPISDEWLNGDRVLFIGSAGNDNYTGTTGMDVVYAGAGTDTLNAGDGDDFIVATTAAAGESFSGLGGFDTLVVERGASAIVGGTFNGFYASDYTAGTLSGLERISFGNPTNLGLLANQLNSDKIAIVSAAEVASGLSSSLSVIGVSGRSDVVEVDASGGALNLSGWIFGNWTTAVGGFSAGEDLVLVQGSGVQDNVVGTSVADMMFGNNGDDILSGGSGEDTLDGGIGNDTLDGGAGADLMSGGTGDDTYVIDNVGDVITENASEGIDAALITVSGYTLGANVEVAAIQGSVGLTLAGNGSDNALYGAGGDDTINGGAGNDTIRAGAGNDTMAGGTGSDTYIVAQAGDVVVENLNEGIDVAVVQIASAYTLTANVEIGATFLGTAVNITGNGLDNLLYGNAGNDTLNGAAGNDTIQGGAGNDTMIGGTGNDTFFVEDGGDVITENLGEGTDAAIVFTSSYTLADNVEVGARFLTSAYTLTGNGLDNQLYGNAGNDTLNGGDGNDTLQGGGGNDTLTGGIGNDTYIIDDAGDVVNENSNEGTDAIILLVSSYTLSANVEVGATFLTSATTITGNGLDNRLYGNAGGDTLDGGAGNDFIQGSGGIDTLIGGTGNDVFLFDAGQSNGDIITDFAGNGAAAGDVLRFSGYGTLAGGATFVQLDATHWQINSANGLIHDTITLSNGASVDASDWLFV